MIDVFMYYNINIYDKMKLCLTANMPQSKQFFGVVHPVVINTFMCNN